jgi:tetratricopeptide (TPR) repeat protein
MEQQVNVTQANDKTSLVCRADELFEQTERLRSSGRIKQALQLGREALDLYTQAGDQAGIARTSHGLATLAQTRGEYDAALGWYYKSVAIQGQLGDQAGLAASYSNIGSIHYARGDYEAALEWYERSVALKEALGDRAGLATTYNNIGLIHDARSGRCTAPAGSMQRRWSGTSAAWRSWRNWATGRGWRQRTTTSG